MPSEPVYLPPNDLLQHLDNLDRGISGRGGPRNCVASGWTEYAWRLPDGSTTTDSELFAAGKMLPPEGSVWLREVPSERGHEALRRFRSLMRARALDFLPPPARPAPHQGEKP